MYFISTDLRTDLSVSLTIVALLFSLDRVEFLPLHATQGCFFSGDLVTERLDLDLEFENSDGDFDICLLPCFTALAGLLPLSDLEPVLLLLLLLLVLTIFQGCHI